MKPRPPIKWSTLPASTHRRAVWGSCDLKWGGRNTVALGAGPQTVPLLHGCPLGTQQTPPVRGLSWSRGELTNHHAAHEVVAALHVVAVNCRQEESRKYLQLHNNRLNRHEHLKHEYLFIYLNCILFYFIESCELFWKNAPKYKRNQFISAQKVNIRITCWKKSQIQTTGQKNTAIILFTKQIKIAN